MGFCVGDVEQYSQLKFIDVLTAYIWILDNTLKRLDIINAYIAVTMCFLSRTIRVSLGSDEHTSSNLL